MRHHIVTRIVVSLVALWIAAVALFAWSVTRPQTPGAEADGERPALTGEALFVRHCGTCHEAADTGVAYRGAQDPEAAAAVFREFLVDHYGPSPGGITLIVNHLMRPDIR